MVECKECGTKLGILEGYRHPTMGKKHPVCSKCFDQVSESVARWEEFVLSNSFNKVSSSSAIQLNLKKIIPNITKIRDTFDSELTEKKIY